MPSPHCHAPRFARTWALVALAVVGLCGCQMAPRAGLLPRRKVASRARNCYPAVHKPVAACLAGAMAANASAPPAGPRRLEVLALSGGVEGAAYAAGVLVGWTKSGTRPTFDVVTGVSSGALLGAFAFLGPKYDGELERLTLTLSTSDLYKLKPVTGPLLHGAFGSTAPAERLLRTVVNDQFLADLRQAHAEGRRFFVGTMAMETRRLVVWDVGAVATSGRPDADEIVRKILLAAFTYPGLAPPVELPAEPGAECEFEEHCDAGLVTMAFVRFGPVPGWPDPGAAARPGWLAGSNLYVLACRKLYSDPAPVPKRALPRSLCALTASLQALARAHINQLYALCTASGMRFHLLAAPRQYQGCPVTFMKLIQEDTPRLFALGQAAGASGPCWRLTPPGAEPGEESVPRDGCAGDAGPQAAGGPAPAVTIRELPQLRP